MNNDQRLSWVERTNEWKGLERMVRERPLLRHDGLGGTRLPYGWWFARSTEAHDRGIEE